MLKKTLIILIALTLTLALIACNDNDSTSEYSGDYMDDQQKEELAEDWSRIQSEQAEYEKSIQDHQGSAISWKDAKQYANDGDVCVWGEVKTISLSNGNGNPTFIDIGKEYPNKNRLTIVIWDESFSNFDDIESYVGKSIYVTGEVYIYNGIAQIEVSDPEQIEVEQ